MATRTGGVGQRRAAEDRVVPLRCEGVSYSSPDRPRRPSRRIAALSRAAGATRTASQRFHAIFMEKGIDAKLEAWDRNLRPGRGRAHERGPVLRHEDPRRGRRALPAGLPERAASLQEVPIDAMLLELSDPGKCNNGVKRKANRAKVARGLLRRPTSPSTSRSARRSPP